MTPQNPRLPNLANGPWTWRTGNGSGSGNDGKIRTLTNHTYFSTRTPGWKTLSSWQKRATSNSFSNVAAYMYYYPGSASFRTWAVNGMYGYIFGGIPPVGVRTTVTDARAKALSKVQGRIQRFQVNMAQTLAERKQAVSMISKRAYQMVAIARALRSGKTDTVARLVKDAYNGFRKSPDKVMVGSRGFFIDKQKKRKWPQPKQSWSEFARTGTGDLADLVLEAQYGWRPLMSDIYGACEVLADTYYRKYPTVFSAQASAERFLQGNTTASFYEMNVNVRWQGAVQETVRYVIEVVEDDKLGTALAATGLSNPALLAWELVPWSFVVDWLWQVGDYLEQLQYAQGLKFVKGTVATRGKRDAIAVGFPTVQSGIQVLTCDIRADYREEYKTREVFYTFPYAMLPSFDPKLGVERAINGIALFSQALTGRKVRR